MFKKISIISALLFCFTLSTAQADVMSYYFDGTIDDGYIYTGYNRISISGSTFTGSFVYSDTEARFSINIPDILQSSVMVEAQQYIVRNNYSTGADSFIVHGQEYVGMFDAVMHYSVMLADESGKIFDDLTPTGTYYNPADIVMFPNLDYARGTTFDFSMFDSPSPDLKLQASGRFNDISTTDPNAAPPAAATPEPASALLTGLGLAGLIALGRRRKTLA